MSNREAAYWIATENGNVRCGLCPHRCHIAENKAGICGVRENLGGKLVACGYGAVSSIALDPIEKKPLYMFHPGTYILSVGGYGCNLQCQFCQNYEISVARQGDGAKQGDGSSAFCSENSRNRPPAWNHLPDDIAKLAVQTVPDGNIGVAYTYNEPLIGYEFLCDCAKLVRDAGLYNVLVTNGYINKEPLEALLPLIDAMNIDLKGFTDGFYKKVGGDLETVKETIAISHRRCHVEVTTLVIPGENEEDIEHLAKWLSTLSPDIPLHLSRFFPRYRYSDREPTPRETIYRLRDIAGKYLKNVFTGNM